MGKVRRNVCRSNVEVLSECCRKVRQNVRQSIVEKVRQSVCPRIEIESGVLDQGWEESLFKSSVVVSYIFLLLPLRRRKI